MEKIAVQKAQTNSEIGLTKEEKEIILLAGDIFNKYTNLPVYNKFTNQDIMHAVHKIQDLVLARVAYRTNADILNWQK